MSNEHPMSRAERILAAALILRDAVEAEQEEAAA